MEVLRLEVLHVVSPRRKCFPLWISKANEWLYGMPGILQYMDNKSFFTEKIGQKSFEQGTYHLLLWPSDGELRGSSLINEVRRYWGPSASHIHFICNKAYDKQRRKYTYQVVKAIMTVRRNDCPKFKVDWMISNNKPFHVEARSSAILNVGRDKQGNVYQEYDFVRTLEPGSGRLERACAWWCFSPEANRENGWGPHRYFSDMTTKHLTPDTHAGQVKWDKQLFDIYSSQWQFLTLRGYKMLNQLMSPDPDNLIQPMIGSGINIPELAWDVRLLSSVQLAARSESPLEVAENSLRDLENRKEKLIPASGSFTMPIHVLTLELDKLTEHIKEMLEEQDAVVSVWGPRADYYSGKTDLRAKISEAKANTAKKAADGFRNLLEEVNVAKAALKEQQVKEEIGGRSKQKHPVR